MRTRSVRIRCRARKIRNILERVRDETRTEIKVYRAAVR